MCCIPCWPYTDYELEEEPKKKKKKEEVKLHSMFAPYAPQPQPVYCAGYPPGYVPQACYVLQPVPQCKPVPVDANSEQIQRATNTGAYDKHDHKPADDDMLKMYWCREVDGSWTTRNRLTMEQKDPFGDFYWNSTANGQWWAVRLAKD